jgi:sulfate/thiosulfate transport system permease protein
LILGLAMGFLGIFLIIPLGTVFAEGLNKGVGLYFASITDPEALKAIRLTLLTAAIAVAAQSRFRLGGVLGDHAL